MGVVARAIFSGVSQGVLSLGRVLDPESSLRAISKAAEPIAPRLAKSRRKRGYSSTQIVVFNTRKRL